MIFDFMSQLPAQESNEKQDWPEPSLPKWNFSALTRSIGLAPSPAGSLVSNYVSPVGSLI